jgi:hypothetical protein
MALYNTCDILERMNVYLDRILANNFYFYCFIAQSHLCHACQYYIIAHFSVDAITHLS